MKILSDDIGEVKNKIRLGINGYMIFIYGHNVKVHDPAVGKKGSFKRVIEKIKGLTRNNQYVIANVIVTEKNYKYLKNIVRLLINLDVFHIQLTLSKNKKLLDFRKIKQHIFETLDMKLKPEYEKLEIYFSDSKESFFLPTIKESLEKIIEFNIWKSSILNNKKNQILENSKILKKWNEIENKLFELEEERNREWKEIEKNIRNLEKRREEIEKEIKLTRKNRILNDLKRLEENIRNLEKRRSREWKKIEPYENRRKDIESKKIELLKKNRILDEWKEIDKSKKKLQKEFNKKWKGVRVPKIIELGQMLEKEYLVTKGELTEPLHLLKSEIRRIDEELMSMWNKEFLSIDREIVRLTGKESLLLKSKGLENIWKKLNEEKDEVERKIDEIRGEKFILIEDKIDELRKKRYSVIKNRVFSKLDGLEKERNDIQKKIDKIRSRKLTLIEDKIDKLKLEMNSLLMKHGILKKWNVLEKEREDIENKNQLLKTELKKLELNRQINSR